jgi:hypothetical protein
MKAAINGYQSIVIILLEKKADIEAKDRVSCYDTMHSASRVYDILLMNIYK